VLQYTPNNQEAHARLTSKLKELMGGSRSAAFMVMIATKVFSHEICSSETAFRSRVWLIKTARFASAPIQKRPHSTPTAKRMTSTTCTSWTAASFLECSRESALTIMANALRVGDHLKQRLGVATRSAALSPPRFWLEPDMRFRSLGIFSLSVLVLSAGLFQRVHKLNEQRLRVLRSSHRGRTDSNDGRGCDRSVDFYSHVLTFEKISDTEMEVKTSSICSECLVPGPRRQDEVGDESIELIQFLAPRGRAIPTDSRSNDLWFQHMPSSSATWTGRIRCCVKTASSTLRPDHNACPTGIKMPRASRRSISRILTSIPWRFWNSRGQGSGKVAQTERATLLGIDHTAIAVSNTETSLKFYRDVLGMRVAGESENTARSRNISTTSLAPLRITALRAATGPGIEFLEYLTPRDGRPIPADEHANDIVHRERS